MWNEPRWASPILLVFDPFRVALCFACVYPTMNSKGWTRARDVNVALAVVVPDPNGHTGVVAGARANLVISYVVTFIIGADALVPIHTKQLGYSFFSERSQDVIAPRVSDKAISVPAALLDGVHLALDADERCRPNFGFGQCDYEDHVTLLSQSCHEGVQQLRCVPWQQQQGS